MSFVLIVDDKENNVYYLTALLAGHGFTVQSARHGAEALVLARKAPPDLIVSDLLMPVMDGYTLLRHWKADPRLKRIPFVVYTATYTEAEDERLALNLGADAFIVKPTEPEAFLERIRQVQANLEAAVPAAPRFPIGDERALLKVYSETLIRKLEEKTLQLEDANLLLQRDNDERRLSEENLRESEERFRATFEQAAVGIAHVAPDGKFLRVNDKLCEITGYGRDELLQRTFADLAVADDMADGENARQAMLAGLQSVYAVEKRYLKKGGRVYWVNVVTTLLRGPAAEAKYFITVISDITERKAMEEQFLRAQRMESIGTLAGGIAHDLNNLLSPIVMGVGLLKMDVTEAESAEIIDSIERSALRGTNLVKQVLSFARGVEGSRATIHLSHLTREIQDFVQSTFLKSIVFKATVPEDTWLIQGDPTQLNQVLLNLCVNARDAMPDGGMLRINARNLSVDDQYAAKLRAVAPGRYVLLEISDTGAGIPPEIREHIFEPFFTTKDPGKGTGIGLSTVLTIVKGHGGSISVESEMGKGTTFRVLLPVRVEPAVARVPASPAASVPRGHGQLMLVVDDDPAILNITRQTLESFGYRVLGAEDGARAIALYAMRCDEVALVLMDMAMPVMGGSLLINALRKIRPDVCIIATSGIQGNEALAKAAGVKYYVGKPFTAEALLSLMDRALGDRAAPKQA